MDDWNDTCRAKAEKAQREAGRATNEVDRKAWLQLAHEWLSLVRKDPEGDKYHG